MTPITQNPSPAEKMQRVLKALKLFGEQVPDAVDVPGASVEEIAEAERLIGRPFPSTMRQLYAAHNGSQRIVNCWPLLSDEAVALTVVSGSDLYRSWEWPVPPELLLFADDGSESAYGLWIFENSGLEPIVVELGEGEDSYAIVGDDLASFLLGQAAVYFVLEGSEWYDTASMINALGIPLDLRAFERNVVGQHPDIHGNLLDIADVGEEVYLNLIRWANPRLPHPSLEPFDHLMTVEEINQFVATRED